MQNSENDFTYSNSSQNYVEPYKKDSKSRGCSSFRPIIICILIFELCERLCFYSINANFVKFCTNYLEVDNVTALNLSLIFTGAIYMLSVFCGWLSDSILGKFYMIILSGLLYFIGVMLITVVTFDFEYHFEYAYLNKVDKRIFSGFGLVLISFGTGGIKTVVGPFGAQQLENSDSNAIKLYFIWLYWFVNIGAFFAFTVVAYIEQNVSFFYGFLVPLTSLLIALIVFLIPSRHYHQNNNMENGIGDYFGALMESFQKKIKSDRKFDNMLDYARFSNGGSYDDKVINNTYKMNRILPILLTFIPFNVAYVQMQTSYFVQGEHMNLHMGSNFTIPVASLNVVNNLVIIFIIPIMAIVVYPLFRYFFGKDPTPLQRIGFGLFIAGLSVLLAGFIEMARKHELAVNGPITQIIFQKPTNVSSLSILTQIPQFFLVGTGEVFALATGLELAYSQAPVSQRSVVSGLFYFMMGAGSFLGSAIIALVNVNKADPWMPDNIDNGHYEYFYFLLFGLLMLDVIIFIFIAKRYKYADGKDEETDDLIISYRKYTTNIEEVTIEGKKH